MASWSFEEVAETLTSWPPEIKIDGTIWNDLKVTDNQTVPESVCVPSDDWILDSDQWKTLFTDANDDAIGAKQPSFQKVTPSFADLSLQKSISALDLSTAELSLDDIMSPALDIEGWDDLSLENAADILTPDDILASLDSNEAKVDVLNESEVTLKLQETEMMLASDIGISVKERKRDATKSWSMVTIRDTSIGGLKSFESNAVTEKVDNFVDFDWITDNGIQNVDNYRQPVEGNNGEAKKTKLISPQRTKQAPLDRVIPPSNCNEDNRPGLAQTSLTSQNTDEIRLNKDFCQLAMDDQDNNLYEILTEFEHESKGVKLLEHYPEREFYTQSLKDPELKRIQNPEGAERAQAEIVEESVMPSESFSVTDNHIYQRQGRSNRKKYDSKFRRHSPCRKQSFRSSHRNARIAFSERQSTFTDSRQSVPVQPLSFQSTSPTSATCFPPAQVPSASLPFPDVITMIPLPDTSYEPSISSLSSLTRSFSTLSSVHEPQMILPIGTPINIPTKADQIQEELDPQSLLVGHFQSIDEHRQEVHSQVKHPEKGNGVAVSDELISMPIPPVSSALPVEWNMISDLAFVKKENSFEATLLHHLQGIIVKLDIDTRLMIRDGLYRLARNAANRKSTGDDKSSSSSSLDFENTINGIHSSLQADLQPIDPRSRRYIEDQNAETKTNPIDRAIADLLFHRRNKSQLEGTGVMELSSLCDANPSARSSGSPIKSAPSIFRSTTGNLHSSHSQEMVTTLSSKQQNHYPSRNISEHTRLHRTHWLNQRQDTALGSLPQLTFDSCAGFVADLPSVDSLCADTPRNPSSVFPLQNIVTEGPVFMPLAPPDFICHPLPLDLLIPMDVNEATNMQKCLIESRIANDQMLSYGGISKIELPDDNHFQRDANQIRESVSKMSTAAPNDLFQASDQSFLAQQDMVEFNAVIPHG